MNKGDMTIKMIKQKLIKTLLMALALTGLSATAEAQVLLGPGSAASAEFKEKMRMALKKTNVDADFAKQHELIMTPEITAVVDSTVYMRINPIADNRLKYFGVKDRSQLLNLQTGKAMAVYELDSQGLKFMDRWECVVSSGDEPVVMAEIRPADNGQYRVGIVGDSGLARKIYGYEHKDLIVGILRVYGYGDYLYMKKDNRDIFLKTYDYQPRTFDLNDVENQYSLSDIINMIINR